MNVHSAESLKSALSRVADLTPKKPTLEKKKTNPNPTLHTKPVSKPDPRIKTESKWPFRKKCIRPSRTSVSKSRTRRINRIRIRSRKKNRIDISPARKKKDILWSDLWVKKTVIGSGPWKKNRIRIRLSRKFESPTLGPPGWWVHYWIYEL